jgi:hypothetical protein
MNTVYFFYKITCHTELTLKPQGSRFETWSRKGMLPFTWVFLVQLDTGDEGCRKGELESQAKGCYHLHGMDLNE